MRSAWTFAGLLAAVPVLALAQPPGAADSAAWRKANVVAGVFEFVADTRDAAVFIDPSDEGYDPTGLPMEMTVRYEYFAAAPGRAEQSASARMGFDCEAGRTRLVLTQYHARHNLAGAARVERSAASTPSMPARASTTPPVRSPATRRACRPSATTRRRGWSTRRTTAAPS